MTVAFLSTRPPDPSGFLIWCVIGMAIGIGLFVYGFRLLQRRRLILDTPLSKIRSASMGMLEVSGLAEGPYTMIAPITGRACYYYRTVAWEYRQNGKNKEWVKIAGECMYVPFFIDDNTGRVLVDPRGADLDLHCDFKQEFNSSFFTHDDAPASVIHFLTRNGVATINQLKVEEYCIKPKNSLFVLGTLAENPDLEVTAQPVPDNHAFEYSSTRGGLSVSISRSYVVGGLGKAFDADSLVERFATRSGATNSTVVMLSPNAAPGNATDMTQQQRVATALMKAGISNPAAWAAAGATDAGPTGMQVMTAPPVTAEGAAEYAVQANPATPATDFDAHPPTVLKKGANNKTFLISWRSQQELARSLGWKCTLMIWGGPAIALISLYFFLAVEQLFNLP